MKIRLVGAELIHAGRLTDRRGLANAPRVIVTVIVHCTILSEAFRQRERYE